MKHNIFSFRLPCAPHHAFNNIKNTSSSNKQHAITFLKQSIIFLYMHSQNKWHAKLSHSVNNLKTSHAWDVFLLHATLSPSKVFSMPKTHGFNYIFLFSISFSLPNIVFLFLSLCSLLPAFLTHSVPFKRKKPNSHISFLILSPLLEEWHLIHMY